MRQIFLDKGTIVAKEVVEPLLEDTTVLISVYYSFISPETESTIISHAHNKQSFFARIPDKVTKILESISTSTNAKAQTAAHAPAQNPIQSLGYSCSGKVIAVGKKVKKFRSGDIVACIGAEYAHHADIVSVPENLVTSISDEKFIQEASMAAVGATALQALRRAHVQIGEYVCVFGLGIIGQITTQLAVLSGCKVIGIDPSPEQRAYAEKYGAYATYAGDEITLHKIIAHLTEQQGVDHTFISGNFVPDKLVEYVTAITRKKGTVILVGTTDFSLTHDMLCEKEIDVRMSHSYGPGRHDVTYEHDGLDYPYPYVRWTENRNMKSYIELIEQKKLHIRELIDQTVHIEHAEKAYNLIKHNKTLGVILQYLPKEHTMHECISTKTTNHVSDDVTFKPAIKDTIRIGFVGAGKITHDKLLPLISRLKKTKVSAIVDKHVATSLSTSKRYGAARVLTDARELFDQDVVDAVVIASPHKLHYEHALNALKEGKAVFLEKPMATNNEQLQQLMAFLKAHPQAPFCVDYNRSFSPFMRRIKEAVKGHSTPLMIQYRMNAGYIPKKHWIQTELGAGRIIGEACHIFDLFAYLTDARPRAVSVESLRPSHDDLFPTDNFSVAISYSDGSVCSLLYTALGHELAGREYMELYFDSKTIIMNDYKTLKGYGLTNSFDCTSKTQDKGREHLLETFFAALRTPTYTSPISIERLESVAQLTFTIDQLAVQGGGVQELKGG